MTPIRFLRTLASAIAWVVVALVIAFGAAGIVATMTQMPGTPGRAELTWAGDTAVEPALDAATVDLEALSAEVDELGSTARRALTQVIAGDLSELQVTIAAGTARLAGVQERTNELEVSLAAVPHAGDDWPLYLAPELRNRYVELATTSGLTTGLEDDWASLSGRALTAARVSTLLARHDEETAAAARLGSAGRYKQALAGLGKSDATIAQSRSLRDRLAGSTDVSTLTTWIDRNAGYDEALAGLYQALLDSRGRVTDAVRRAYDDEQAARSALPGDTRGLVVIMSDVAQGGLNQAVIAIEEARGSLAQALEVQQQLRDGSGTVPPG